MSFSDLKNLYKQVILDHSKHPRNNGDIENSYKLEMLNPSCGDKITVSVKLVDDIIDDIKRIRYIEQHLHKVLEARGRGVNIQGYFIWSLQDQFSWVNGYNKRYGLFFVDYETQKRYIKKSALWVKGLKRN